MKSLASIPLVLPLKQNLATVVTSLWIAAACSSEGGPSQTKEAWDSSNNPNLFSLEIKKLEELPKEGNLPDEKFPWTDDYWATYAGGISRRWQKRVWGTNYEKYLYDPIDGEAFRNDPGSVDVKKLSPAEKFDLYQNRYDFPLTRFEQERTRHAVNPETNSIPTWVGLCHGWAPASLMEPEPGEVAVVKNEQGIEIPFYTSDITALMTHVYAFSGNRYRFLGRRCNTAEHDIEYDENRRVIQSECRDINPGTLHLALAQLLGAEDPAKREGFVLDFYLSDQVWNHPVVGYKVKSIKIEDFDRHDDKLAAFRADGTKKLAKMKVDVYYASGSQPHMSPMLAQRNSYTASQRLEYTLELDADGRIIGGEWTSKNRPDFMWMLSKTPIGTDLLPHDKVKELVALSRHENAPPDEPGVPGPPSETPTSPADSAAGLPNGPLSAADLGVPAAPLPRF